MRATLLIVGVIVCASTSSVWAQRALVVPSGWKQVSEDARTRTRRFTSPDGQGTLITTQTEAARGALARDLDEIADRSGEQITYQRRGSSWIAVSGYIQDQIFYRKANLACGGSRWNIIEFRYPRADKAMMDAAVTRAAHVMTRYGKDCG